MIKIQTLLDNVPTEHKSLISRHGLSLFVQTDSKQIVFDCGPDETAIRNARLMNVPITEADYIICSHSHYDHSGGFPDFIRAGVKGTFYTGPGYFEPKYAYDGVKYTYLGAGFGEEFLAENGIVHKECKKVIQLDKNCWLFAGFPRTHAFETIPSRFVKGNLPEAETDDFGDEVCLATETSKGLVVTVGCSHPGILNMLTYIHETLDKPIYAVFGGTHLVEADEARITKTMEEMKAMGLEVIGLSHCSGEKAEGMIHETAGVHSCHLGTGDCFALI